MQLTEKGRMGSEEKPLLLPASLYSLAEQSPSYRPYTELQSQALDASFFLQHLSFRKSKAIVSIHIFSHGLVPERTVLR